MDTQLHAKNIYTKFGWNLRGAVQSIPANYFPGLKGDISWLYNCFPGFSILIYHTQVNHQLTPITGHVHTDCTFELPFFYQYMLLTSVYTACSECAFYLLRRVLV